MPGALWANARDTQLALPAGGEHRRVPPADLILAAAEAADVALVHYDRRRERIAGVSGLRHHWLVLDGTFA